MHMKTEGSEKSNFSLRILQDYRPGPILIAIARLPGKKNMIITVILLTVTKEEWLVHYPCSWVSLYVALIS